MLSEIKRKNKKGVSEMVGYVLLITLAVVMGVIAYNWMKTYIPREAGSCPDGVSIFIKEAALNESNSQLSLTLKNNGRFDIHGYFIYARNSSTQELATIDLSQYLNKSFGGIKVGNYIKFFSLQDEILNPGDEVTHIFNIPSNLNLYSLSIIPTRFQEENNKEKFVSCGNALTNQIVGEPGIECVDENISITCGTRICGARTNNCGDTVSCGSCTLPNVCNLEGQCVSSACVPDTNVCLNKQCGLWNNGTCGQAECGTCGTGYECNITRGQCVALCGNGVQNLGEQCDDSNNISEDGCSSTCQIEAGYTCSGWPSICTFSGGGGVSSCQTYCNSVGYTGNPQGICEQNANCPAGGTYDSLGDKWCTTQTGDFCCCQGTLPQRIVFASSTTYPGTLGGLSGADSICNSLKGSISGTFVAWLSNSTIGAKDRIPTGSYYLTNPLNLQTVGTKIADNKADLLDGTLDTKINRDQSGSSIGGHQNVWTGTNSNGTLNANNCNNWQSSSSSVNGLGGDTDVTSSTWTAKQNNACNQNLKLYCFRYSG